MKTIKIVTYGERFGAVISNGDTYGWKTDGRIHGPYDSAAEAEDALRDEMMAAGPWYPYEAVLERLLKVFPDVEKDAVKEPESHA